MSINTINQYSIVCNLPEIDYLRRPIAMDKFDFDVGL